MDNLKKKSVDMLCRFGKFGLGKTLIIGMYDIEVPAKLRDCLKQEDNIADEKESSDPK